MRRADRLFQVVQRLRGGRLVTARQLADAFDVSERTIYRDVADLVSSGIPIEGEAGVGYRLREGFHLPPLMFTPDEVVALVVGARMVRAFGGAAMARNSEEALVKIEAVLPEPARRRAHAVPVHALSVRVDDEHREALDALDAAIEARRKLGLVYEDAAGRRTERVVRPLGLTFWGQVWTLVAWCELRDGPRMFRVDRIAQAQPGLRFRPEPGQSLGNVIAMLRDGADRDGSGRRPAPDRPGR